MKSLKRGDVLVLLVGDEALETVGVQIGEGQLRTGMRTLAPTDQPGPVRPVGEIDFVGQLGHPRPSRGSPSWSAAAPPCRSFNAKQGFAHRLADQIAERETDIALPTGVREIVARPGGIRARENLPIKRVPRQLPKRQIERLDVIVGVVRPAFPGRRIPAATTERRASLPAGPADS